MSTLTDLAGRAERAATVLRDAEAAQTAELEAAKGRNRDRRTAHWRQVNADVLPKLVEGMRDAHEAVAAAVRDAGEVGAAYGAYVAAHARWQATHNAVADGLVTYVNDLTGEPHPDPEERWGRAVYPEGVGRPAFGAPESFVRMVEAATKGAHQTHMRETAAELRAPLQAELERENGDR